MKEFYLVLQKHHCKLILSSQLHHSKNHKSSIRCYIKGKVDSEGLKENVIVGRLVPAGTGLTKIGWDKEARNQDKTRLEEFKKELESASTALSKLSRDYLNPIFIDFCQFNASLGTF